VYIVFLPVLLMSIVCGRCAGKGFGARLRNAAGNSTTVYAAGRLPPSDSNSSTSLGALFLHKNMVGDGFTWMHILLMTLGRPLRSRVWPSVHDTTSGHIAACVSSRGSMWLPSACFAFLRHGVYRSKCDLNISFHSTEYGYGYSVVDINTKTIGL
jgi:hypothetical protein